MILDWKANVALAHTYDVFDASTGECLNELALIYVDTDKGLVRRQAMDEAGEWVVNDEGTAPVVIEERRAVRIERKPGYQGAITIPKLYEKAKTEKEHGR